MVPAHMVPRKLYTSAETWTWKSYDGTKTCRGEDQIDGKKGYYDCTGVEDDIQEAFNAPTPPAPEVP